MSSFTDGIVEQYLNQDPERRKAYALDPQTHHQTNLLRRLLEATERAMEGEGVPAETRARVLCVVVYGDAEPRMARDEARELLLTRFDPSEFGFPSDSGSFAALAEHVNRAEPRATPERPVSGEETSG